MLLLLLLEMDEEITEIEYTELHEHFRPHSFLRVDKLASITGSDKVDKTACKI